MPNAATAFGPVAESEFEHAADCHKEELTNWLAKLPTESDEDFFWAAASAIASSALAEGFRGNWEHEHCKVTAAYNESKRRHLAAGHADDCTGDTIYSRAFAQAWREQGHSPSAYPPRACDCGAGR
jgi:hypothetical protein